jgi:hypothetical protein
MLTLSKDEAEAWCRSRGLRLDAQLRPDAPSRAESFTIPEDAGRRIAMVTGIASRKDSNAAF